MSLVPLGAPEATGGGAWVVVAEDGRRFAVFAVGDGYRVTDARCPHNGGPLEQGRLDRARPGHEGSGAGPTVVCPWHWYRFDLDSGRCATNPRHRLGTYPVVERDGRLFADVGAPARALSWSERLRELARGGER
jgi:nitrite reductase/ring-hydroxylating ferredoxin subunit